MYRVAEKIASETNLAKPKHVDFNKLFPEFDDKAIERKKFDSLSEDNREKLIANKWREFLGI